MLPRLGEKRKAVLIARTIESAVSTYLLTTAAINIGEAALVTLAMWLIGMPTPAKVPTQAGSLGARRTGNRHTAAVVGYGIGWRDEAD